MRKKITSKKKAIDEGLSDSENQKEDEYNEFEDCLYDYDYDYMEDLMNENEKLQGNNTRRIGC